MTKIFTFLVLILMVSGACKKNTDIANGEQSGIRAPGGATNDGKGSLSGTVTPIEGVDGVTVTALTSGGKTFLLKVNPVNGAYVLNDLPEGQYKVEPIPTEDYTTPSAIIVTVTAGEDSKINSIVATRIIMRCDIDGVLRKWAFLRGHLSSDYLQLYIPTTGGTPGNNFSLVDRYALSFYLDGFTGPGTYICEPGSKSTFRYTVFRSLPITIQTSVNEGSRITVVISEFDSASRTVKGSFSGTLSSRSSIPPTTFTKGKIDGKYINSP